MGSTTAQRITAAPKKLAVVSITVRFKSAGKPVRGAAALLLLLEPGKEAAVRNLGVSDALGRVRFKQEQEIVELQLAYPNHLDPSLAPTPNSYYSVVFHGFLAEGLHNFEVALVQVRSQVLMELKDPTGAPIPGARVTAPSGTGTTDEHGKFTTPGLDLNQRHALHISRNGHAAPNEPTPKPLVVHVDLQGTEVTDTHLNLQMQNLWGKVKSADITIGGLPFSKWFPQVFARAFPAVHPTLIYLDEPAQTFPFRSGMGRAAENPPTPFDALFNDLTQWWGAELTLEEFVSIFLIMANETGGTFKPMAEVGSLAYMFYLNKGPNRLAGDQLLAKGLLKDPSRVLAWNKKKKENFPGEGTDGITAEALRECDFWKYRGRGFVQTTLRTLYMDRVDPVLKAAGFQPSENLTAAELDDAVMNQANVYYPLLRTELQRRRKWWAQTNAENWKGFGYSVAGDTNHTYVALYEWRCQELYAALRKAAENGQLVMK